LNIVLAFWLWPLLALIAFKVLPPHKAVLSTVLGGWILLPVGIYPAGATSSVFPYWLVGSAVPSDMLVTKAWVAPASAMIGMVLTDWRRLSKFKANIFDLPMLGWCLWPVIQGYLTQISLPDAVLSSAYLIGTWGFPWLLGRLYFSNFEKQRSLLIGIAWSGYSDPRSTIYFMNHIRLQKMESSDTLVGALLDFSKMEINMGFGFVSVHWLHFGPVAVR